MTMDTAVRATPAVDAQMLLNAWQRDLPLVARPFDALGAPHGLAGAAVRDLALSGDGRTASTAASATPCSLAQAASSSAPK